MPYSVFISYSHRDRELRGKLEKHLSNLRRQKVIASWYDGDISPGTEWKSQISEHLNRDQIILFPSESFRMISTGTQCSQKS